MLLAAAMSVADPVLAQPGLEGEAASAEVAADLNEEAIGRDPGPEWRFGALDPGSWASRSGSTF